MPFTFCHPAIVLPLTKISRNRISATGLIIGSMSPDFEYFIKMRLEGLHGHTLAGLIYFDLPVTLIAAFFFHLYVRDALILNLPEVLKKRLIPFVGLNWIDWVKRYWYVLIYSALIGIFSHVFWDAFTHTNGFFVERIPTLQVSVNIFGQTMPIADLGQLLSSLFGGAFILIALMIPPKPEISMNQLKRKIYYWLMIVLITAITLLIRNGQGLGDFIATTIAGGFIGLVLAPVILKYTVKK